MKSIKYLAASLALVALVFTGCQKETFTGIDSSKPAVTEFGIADAPYNGKTVTMKWNASKAVAAGATSFTLQLVNIENEGDVDNYNSTISAVVPVEADRNVNEYTGKISGQTKGARYFVRVRANYKKSIYSDWTWLEYDNGEHAIFKLGRGIITSGIEDPYLYKVTPTSTGIIIKWDAISNATGYVIEYKKSSESDWSTVNCAAEDIVCKIKDLPSETEYNVRALTLTAEGSSDYCETVTVSTNRPGSYPKQMATADEFVAWLEGGVVEVDAADTYEITADIDLSEQNYTAMDEPLLGTFSGNGHTISGVTSPLFYLNEGTVKDVNIKGAITITDPAPEFGALVTTNKGTVSNCSADVAVTFASDTDTDIYIGGLCAHNEGTIENSSNSGDITVTQSVKSTKVICIGGIAARSIVKLDKCNNLGAVSYVNSKEVLGPAVAGIAAYIEGSASGCNNKGNVTLQAAWSTADKGGFIPDLEGRLYASATYATPAVAGIAAYSYSADTTVPLLEKCVNDGQVTFTMTSIDKYKTTVQRVQTAGIIANPYGLIKDCTNNGALNFAANTSNGAASEGTYLMCSGGIGGGDWFTLNQESTSFEGCVNNGNIEYTKYDKEGSSNSTCGGICGWPGKEEARKNVTKNCTNNGNVSMYGTGKARVGGIHGGTGNIEGCISTGTVHNFTANAGSAFAGMAGFHSQGHSIKNSEFTGKVISDNLSTQGVGGLIGNAGNVANSAISGNKLACTISNAGETSGETTGMIVGFFNGSTKNYQIGTASAPIVIKGIISKGGKTSAITSANLESNFAGTKNYTPDVHKIVAQFDPTPYDDGSGNPGEPEIPDLEAPSNVAVSITYNSVTITWDPVDGAEWYIVEYKPKSADVWQASDRNTECKCVLTGLTHGTDYSFRVKAFASKGSGYSSEVDGSTLVEVNLGTPVVSVSASEATTITISWAAVADATGYAVEYKEATAENWTSAGNVTETGKTVNNLKPSTAYNFRVKALGEGGNEGAWSESTSGTTEQLKFSYPLTINTADEFASWISTAAALCSETDETTIGADIDLSGKSYSQAETFAGKLNGNGKTVTVNSDNALFGTVTGTIENLTIAGKVEQTLEEDAEFGHPLASLAIISKGNITGCTNKATVKMSSAGILGSPVVAGLVAYQQGGTFENNTNSGAVTVSHGGSSHVTITGFNRKPFSVMAGVVGVLVKTTAKNCENTGNVTVTCTNVPKITSRQYIGGVIGTPEGAKVLSCTNRGKITGDFTDATKNASKQYWVGGVIGGRNGDVKDVDGAYVEDCKNYGECILIAENKVNNYLAGIAGQATVEAMKSGTYDGNEESIQKLVNCYNYGKLVKKGAGGCRLGGIAGGAATLENCHNEGEILVEGISDAGTVGGLVGYPTQAYHPVTNSSNKGNITATCDVGFAIGGIFGQFGNTTQSHSGCSVNCTISAPSSAMCGIIAGSAKTLGKGKSVTLGTADAPFKVKGSVNGTSLTADNFSGLLTGDGEAVDGKITTAATGTIDVANVAYGE